MAKILLIDDDPVLLKLYSTRLAADRHEVKTSNNGQDGLRLAGEFLPNVIVLDLMMPKLNGFQFLSSIKAMPALTNIPIIVFSSMANPKGNELKSLGAFQVLNKIDTTPTQLVEIVKQTLSPKM